MMEDDMKRNGSGYIDETPVKSGVLTGPQPGEIWEDTNGRPFLILKNQSGYSNVLAMQGNTAYDDNIAINTELGIFFVNPGMVRFLLGRDRGRYIYTIPLDKHMEIMEAVGERLGVTIRVSAADDVDEIINDATLETAALRMKAEDLELLVDKLKAQLKATEAKRDELLDEACAVREDLISRCDGLERELNMKIDDNLLMRDTRERAEERADMWEKMYNTLLDRLFARGEAK